jgi:hypothetical protein
MEFEGSQKKTIDCENYERKKRASLYAVTRVSVSQQIGNEKPISGFGCLLVLTFMYDHIEVSVNGIQKSESVPSTQEAILEAG